MIFLTLSEGLNSEGKVEVSLCVLPRPSGAGGESFPEAELRPGDVREETRQSEETGRQTDPTSPTSGTKA